MEPVGPVFWGEGMFLQPQHFQQQDRYHSGQLREYTRTFLPFPWGIRSLTLNQGALQTFLLEVEGCELATPEGSLLRFGSAGPSNARLEPRSFENALEASGKALSVYIGLRRLQHEDSNIESPYETGDAEQRSHRRFVVKDVPTRDLLGDDDQRQPVQHLLYDARILFDVPESRSQDYELVKIAEVQRAPDGRGGILSQQYIPPSITIRSDPVLESLLKDVRDVLTAKGRELAEYRRKRGGETVELGSRDLGYLFMMQTVNRYIPVLHHDLDVGDIHPMAAYGRLRQLVGELSTFSESVSVLGDRDGEDPLPIYRHDQLYPCFSAATGRAKELLEEMTTGPVGDVALLFDGEYFSAALDEQFVTGDNRYFLAIKSDLPAQQLYDLLQQTGKITSREDMPRLERSALFGLEIKVEHPPEELLMRAHYRYFTVNAHHEHWLKIQRARSIAVLCPSLPADTEMRLVCIYGE